MKCDESFITLEFIWCNYVIFSLDKYINKTFTEMGLNRGFIHTSLAAYHLTVCLVAGSMGWVGFNPDFRDGADTFIVWLHF